MYQSLCAVRDEVRVGRSPVDTLPALVREVMRRHLEGFDAGAARPWGWKLCETTYAVPVIDFLFPGAKFIHLIRDGRDVAFCDHHAPVPGSARRCRGCWTSPDWALPTASWQSCNRACGRTQSASIGASRGGSYGAF
jgi:hypothetical protein